MTRVLLLGGDNVLEERLARIQSDLFVPVSAKYVEHMAFKIDDLMIADHLPNLVVIGSEISHDSTLTIAKSISQCHPEILVVIVAEPHDALLAEANVAGVKDVVSPRSTLEQWESLIAGARDNAKHLDDVHSEDVDQGSRIISVVSPKGGVGKSTISSNLAAGLAKDSPKNVVIVDLDLQFGDVATHLDLEPEHTVADVFSSTGGVDSMLLRTFLTVHSAGFYVLCGPTSPADADEISSSQVHELLHQLAAQFKFVIVDTGAGLDEPTLAAIEEADDIVIVTSMDVACVRNVRKEIDVLSQVRILPEKRHVVLNFADRKSGLGVRDVEAVIGLPVNVVIPRDDGVILASNRGVPVILNKKGGKMRKAFGQLSTRISRAETLPQSRFLHRGVDVS